MYKFGIQPHKLYKLFHLGNNLMRKRIFLELLICYQSRLNII